MYINDSIYIYSESFLTFWSNPLTFCLAFSLACVRVQAWPIQRMRAHSPDGLVKVEKVKLVHMKFTMLCNTILLHVPKADCYLWRVVYKPLLAICPSNSVLKGKDLTIVPAIYIVAKLFANLVGPAFFRARSEQKYCIPDRSVSNKIEK